MNLWTDMHFWREISYVGDWTRLGPLIVALATILVCLSRRREAAKWIAAFLLGGIVILLLKQVGTFSFYVGEQQIRAVEAPSGHAGLGMIVYGQLAVLLWRTRTRLGRALTALPVAALVLVDFAVWHLWWHSLLDIAAGTAIGLLFLVAINWRALSNYDGAGRGNRTPTTEVTGA